MTGRRCGRSLPPEEQQQLRDAVKAWLDTKCTAVSDVPLPAIARRPGHETYHCGREKGHEPPHRWPADTGAIAQW